MSIKPEELKPCPFCGAVLDANGGDTVYPRGVGWKDGPHGRSYHSVREVPREQWCYGVHCRCGAEISGDSRSEAIDKWNTRAIPDTHRVVPIWLLERVINVSAWNEHEAIKELRAIIEEEQP